MTTVLLILVCLLAAALFVMFGALVELYGQVQQIRAHLSMFDTPTPLELGASHGVAPTAVGLPPELDRAETAMVLFLSDKCQTCFELAGVLQGGALPPSLWLVVVPVGGGDAGEFVERFDLRGPRITVDLESRITDRLGLDITPSAVAVRAGRLEQAQTVPTIRQLYALLPAPARKLVLVPKTVGPLAMDDGHVPAVTPKMR